MLGCHVRCPDGSWLRPLELAGSGLVGLRIRRLILVCASVVWMAMGYKVEDGGVWVHGIRLRVGEKVWVGGVKVEEKEVWVHELRMLCDEYLWEKAHNVGKW